MCLYWLLLLLPPQLHSRAWVRPGFTFPSPQQQVLWPPWPSYPPPRPPWALHRPTRAFVPFFGSPFLPTTSSPNYCNPDPVTGNLPFDCVDIIEVRLGGRIMLTPLTASNTLQLSQDLDKISF